MEKVNLTDNTAEEFDKAIADTGLSGERLEYFLNGLTDLKGNEEQVNMRVVGGVYSNSPLVKYTCYSPNCNSPRNHAIDTITIHEVWGECTMASLGAIFKPSSRQASSNYGCCTDGIALFVDEKNRAWTSGSSANDNRAVTIEVSNSRTYPNPVNSKVYAQLIELCADICKRNGKNKMIWCGSLSATNSRKFASNEMRMTLHKWFQATDCPGVWLEQHMQDIADKVNARLNITYPELPFEVNVLIDDLQLRSTATIDSENNIKGYAIKGKHLVEKVKNNMGYIGNGWVYLANNNYVKVGKHVEKSPFKDMETTDARYEYVKEMYECGIFKIDSKGKIKPNSKISRSILALYFVRLIKYLVKTYGLKKK